MGLCCSRLSTVTTSPDSHSEGPNANQHLHADQPGRQSPLKSIGLHSGLPNLPPTLAPGRINNMSKDLDDFRFGSQDFPDTDDKGDRKKLARVVSEKARSAKSVTSVVAKLGAAKVNEMGSLLGRAGTVGLGKAVEALDTIGSSMTSLNIGSGFASGAVPKGNKIGILAFEVANTIVKGFNIKQSLSDDNMKLLKEEILRSEGVQRLVSTDTAELLRIAASDKRNELKIFAREVVRFGNHCRNPQWHQLDRVFENMSMEANPRLEKDELEVELENLMTLAQITAELYHEINALDRFQTDYHRKLEEEEFLNGSQKGDSLAIMKSELKTQKNHVKNLKRRSLWSKILEEVMEKLLDIMHYLRWEIQDAFGDTGEASISTKQSSEETPSPESLGAAGLALHYANLINQIDNLVCRPSSVPPNARDNLYQCLPPNIRASLRTRVQNFPMKEGVTGPQIRAEMEKTLSWLVPIAGNTTKAHHGFGWVGEWANTGSILDRRSSGNTELTLLQTLHHADQETTDRYILELVVWLHYLVCLSRSDIPGTRSPIRSPIHSPVQCRKMLSIDKPSVKENGHVAASSELSQEDHVMLQGVKNHRLTPGRSKSQEFDTSISKSASHLDKLTKSSSHSPISSTGHMRLSQHHESKPSPNFAFDRDKALDVIDRLDNI